MVDDSGTFTDGTIVSEALVDDVFDEIDDQAHSAANPTIKPKVITDEVVAARGGEANLDARLDAIDAILAGIIPTVGDVISAVGRANLVMDEVFAVWAGGDTAAPTAWTLAGAGGAVQRCGTGLADTNAKIGSYCARVTRAAADTTLAQILVSGNAILRAPSAFRGRVVSYGAWVRCSVIGGARLYINDGMGTTYSTANVAADTWEWLTVTRTLNAAATVLVAGLIVDTNAAVAYYSGPTVFLGDVGGAPSEWVPSPVIYESRDFTISGIVTVQASRFVWAPHRPGVVRDVALLVGTAPVGADLIVDVNTWDGAAYTTMFGAGNRPKVVASAFDGYSLAWDQSGGTFARSSLKAAFVGAAGAAGQRLSIDIDQVGSGVPGSDLTISVRMLYPARALEAILEASEVGL